MLDNSRKINIEKNRNGYGQSPHPYLHIDSFGKISYANKAAIELLDNSDEDELSQSLISEIDSALLTFVESNSHLKRSISFDGKHYEVDFCSNPEKKHVEVYLHDVSELLKHRHYFEIVNSFSTALLNTQTESDVAWTVAKQAIAKLEFVDCVVYLVDRNTNQLYQAAAHGPKSLKSGIDQVLNPIILKMDEGIVGAAALQKRTIIIEDASKDARYVVDDEARMSEIAVPIISDGELMGVIDSEHPEKARFTEEDAKILESIASIAATRIHRARAVEEIRHTEEKYRSFVENAFGGLYILRDAHFEYINERFGQITGYTSDELTDPEFDSEKLIIGADQSAKEAMAARERGDFSPKSYELEIKTKSGEIKQLAINTSILEDEKGYYALGIALDVTERVESNRQLEQVVSSLENRTDELNEFAHLASHNLRAPVTNLMGLLEYYNHDDPTDPSNSIIVEKFSTSVDQLNLTLEEMHEILKVRAEKKATFNPVDLNKIMDSVKVQLSEQIRNSRFQIMVDFQCSQIHYDQGHIGNLFLNLVSNAVKYRREGIDPWIKIRTEKVDEGIKIEFEDNGQGIDLSSHGKDLFGLYKKFHSHPDSRGLGLHLVKKQLNALGSTITVDSVPLEGTTFTVILNSK